MTKDEAIHKALKVLNCLNNDRVYETAWVKGAINACEKALEQPEGKEFFERGKEIAKWADKQVQEPVEYLGALANVDGSVNLYFKKDQWQGLTDDEIENLIPDTTAFKCETPVDECIDFARAIEQALKEKNT